MIKKRFIRSVVSIVFIWAIYSSIYLIRSFFEDYDKTFHKEGIAIALFTSLDHNDSIPEFTTDCNYLDCRRIPKPMYFPIDKYISESRKRLLWFRNKHELEMYKSMTEICNLQKKKWNEAKPRNMKPGDSVKIYYYDPKSWFYGVSHYISKCSVGCEVTNYMNESDIVVLTNHMSQVSVDYYLPIKSLLSKTQKLAAMSLENAFYNHFNEFNKYEIMMNNVDYLVHIFPFSDVPIYYSRKYLTDQIRYFVPSEFEQVMKIKKNQTTLVSSFISNCPGEKNDPKLGYYRYQYVLEMEKHIKIDHFGKCTKFRSRKTEPQYSKSRRENKLLISKSYKFTIAFENSIFYNYYTEKLSDVVDGYSVPIYLGPPNINSLIHDDLKSKKIFFDANEFADPKNLVDYLLFLDRNEDAYREFFEWKLLGGHFWKESEYLYNTDKKKLIKNKKEEVVSVFCRLCEFHVFGKKKCHLERYKTDDFIIGFN